MNTHAFKGKTLALLAALATAALLASCGGGSSSNTNNNSSSNGGNVGGLPTAAAPQVFTQASAPAKLSQWNIVGSDGATLAHNNAMVMYDLNSALFSDYALKMRAIYVPAGQKINYNTTSILDFPIGSVIVKTFYYPKATGTDATLTAVGLPTGASPQGSTLALSNYRLIETRIIMRQTDGNWGALTYTWDADQKDASKSIGAYIDMELVPASGATTKFTYVVPTNQHCQQCHATTNAGAEQVLPIGPKARNMNKTYAYSSTVTKNQLQQLSDLNLMAGFTGVGSAPVNANWSDTSQTLEARAKAYLDVNCAHCHNGAPPKGGMAWQSGLALTYENIGNTTTPESWGVCKQPLAYVGTGQAGYKYDINPKSPNSSILLFRMSHVGDGQTMPVLGRQTNHAEAIALVRDWIAGLSQASCTP